jgi:hypothetical protein
MEARPKAEIYGAHAAALMRIRPRWAGPGCTIHPARSPGSCEAAEWARLAAHHAPKELKENEGRTA